MPRSWCAMVASLLTLIEVRAERRHVKGILGVRTNVGCLLCNSHGRPRSLFLMCPNPLLFRPYGSRDEERVLHLPEKICLSNIGQAAIGSIKNFIDYVPSCYIDCSVGLQEGDVNEGLIIDKT